MKKFLKWTVGVLAVILLFAVFVGWPYMKKQTKKISPEQVVTFNQDGQDIAVFYCRPYKKDREIFGGLVPYGKVWRTGANEPSTFETANDLTIDGKTLPAGKYTLWTIPGEDSWEVIFNGKMYGWGVTILSGGKETPREPEADVLKISVPVQKSPTVTEQFTIAFEDIPSSAMTLAWDQTKISVPFQ